jgi:pyruvate carboxylase subunit B
MTVNGIPEEVLVEVLDQIPPPSEKAEDRRTSGGSQHPRATRPGDVTTSMPGIIIEVLVDVGDIIEAGTPVLITEAMKMETEIQAPVHGKVIAINVHKGDRVNPDETLIEIEETG